MDYEVNRESEMATREVSEDSGPLHTEEILRRAAKGDRSAMDLVILKSHEHVMPIVRKRLGPRLRSDCESGDVAQDVMVEVIRSFPRFPRLDRQTFRRWVSGLTENRIRNRARTIRRRPRCVSAEEGALDRVADGRGTKRDFADSEIFRRALNDLSDDHRRIIALRDYHDEKFSDIGRLMDRSEEAASALHARAKMALLKRMRHHYRCGGHPR